MNLTSLHEQVSLNSSTPSLRFQQQYLGISRILLKSHNIKTLSKSFQFLESVHREAMEDCTAVE